MKLSVKETLVAAAAFFLGVLGAHVMAPTQQAMAQEKPAESKTQSDKKEKSDQKSADSEQNSTQASGETFIYVAQPGDSYAQMARKAVQTFGITNDVNLSQAEIIMAETNVSVEAGWPLLKIGQKVTIAVSTVEKWIDKAQDLTDEKEAAWQYYVPGVNFNTDSVGQKR